MAYSVRRLQRVWLASLSIATGSIVAVACSPDGTASGGDGGPEVEAGIDAGADATNIDTGYDACSMPLANVCAKGGGMCVPEGDACPAGYHPGAVVTPEWVGGGCPRCGQTCCLRDYATSDAQDGEADGDAATAGD